MLQRFRHQDKEPGLAVANLRLGRLLHSSLKIGVRSQESEISTDRTNLLRGNVQGRAIIILGGGEPSGTPVLKIRVRSLGSAVKEERCSFLCCERQLMVSNRKLDRGCSRREYAQRNFHFFVVSEAHGRLIGRKRKIARRFSGQISDLLAEMVFICARPSTWLSTEARFWQN